MSLCVERAHLAVSGLVAAPYASALAVITPDEAKLVIEQGSTGPLEFRDRQGPFTGRLVMTDDKSVEVVRADSAEAAA